MRCYIIVPAHNEERFLGQTLKSLHGQTLVPAKVVVVNDHSTDGTEAIIDGYVARNRTVLKVNTTSSTAHMPGSKIVDAFYKGLALLDDGYDFLMKLDADVILPHDYLERIAAIFKKNPMVGIAGGFIYERNGNGEWKRNHPMNADHVRGAIKAYSKDCFKAIGGLRSAMGWDTVDELLAQYHGFTVHTDEGLRVKHLRPVGKAYGKNARLLQGKAMYGMRYGLWISLIASMKMAWKQKKSNAFFDNMKGYRNAFRAKDPFLVGREEGRFIRKLRWSGIERTLFARKTSDRRRP